MLKLNGPNDIPSYRCLGRTISIHYITCAKNNPCALCPFLELRLMSEQVLAE